MLQCGKLVVTLRPFVWLAHGRLAGSGSTTTAFDAQCAPFQEMSAISLCATARFTDEIRIKRMMVMKMMKMVMKMVMLTSTLTTLALPAATTTVAAPTDMSTPLLHLAPTDGDTVGLLWNAAERRYSVMWDASSGCGWGHASTADFLRYTQHGCTGPDRQHGTMSGSVAFGGDGRPRMTYSMGEQIWLATAPNASMAWFTQDSASTPALNLSAAAAHGIAVLDIRDPYMWSGADGRLNMLTGGGARARGGPGGGRGGTGVGPAACERGSCYPEALLWESDDAPRYTHWTFKGQVWSAPADAAQLSNWSRRAPPSYSQDPKTRILLGNQ